MTGPDYAALFAQPGWSVLDRWAGAPGQVDSAGPARDRALIIATVAATLRQLAGWGYYTRGEEFHPVEEELLELADVVEREGVPGDPNGPDCLVGMSCPMCQEITCDTGCPLEPIRTPPDGTVTPERAARLEDVIAGIVEAADAYRRRAGLPADALLTLAVPAELHPAAREVLVARLPAHHLTVWSPASAAPGSSWSVEKGWLLWSTGSWVTEPYPRIDLADLAAPAVDDVGPATSGWELLCTTDVVAEFDNLDQALNAGRGHLATCRSGPPPIGTVAWHAAGDGWVARAEVTGSLNHTIRPKAAARPGQVITAVEALAADWLSRYTLTLTDPAAEASP